MKPQDEASVPAVSGIPNGAPHPATRLSTSFGLALLALVAGFGWPLYELAAFSLQSELYSHIVLIPFISAYLVWMQRQTLPKPSAPDRRIAGMLLGAGALALGGYWTARLGGPGLAKEDSLAVLVFSFLFLFSGICSWFLGRSTLRALAFPLGFLVFMVPFPVAVAGGVETFFQHTSAFAAHALFKLTGTPVFYQDLLFRLPGINLEVAPQCSGIRSSLALFITSVLAGHFFLRSPWKKALLTFAVIPLAIVRNGFRIFTIGELCVRISPDMIDSYIHHRGGPVFFALSLIPFFLLLRYLYKSDRPRPLPASTSPGK